MDGTALVITVGLLIILVLYLGGRLWLAEHDLRLLQQISSVAPQQTPAEQAGSGCLSTVAVGLLIGLLMAGVVITVLNA